MGRVYLSVPCGHDTAGKAGATIVAMKMRKKSDLPTKTCAHCALPFSWRKKWERDWDQVKYCSERCRRSAKPAPKE
jgi:hypothetical protein